MAPTFIHTLGRLYGWPKSCDFVATVVPEYDRRMGRPEEWCNQMETKRHEEAAAKRDADSEKYAAIVALRKAAVQSLRAGISAGWASRFVEKSMGFSGAESSDYWNVTARPSPYMRDMARAAWRADVGNSRLPGNDSGDGEQGVSASQSGSSESGR